VQLLGLSWSAKAQTGVIEGQVTDAQSGDPLPGVNVVIVGSQQGAATDGEGLYQISGVEAGLYDLRASFVGYSDQVVEDVEVVINQTTEVNFTLQREEASLEEIVVVGYGTQRRRDLTGSVASVTTEQLDAAPMSSIDEVLQGQVAGVQVTTNSTKPGGGISVRIRGAGSITSGAEPLYVIDGVPVYNDTQGFPGTGTASVAPNPLAAINPQDIESIEVLKDASATAIYGARGANGVVLITTKQGREGQTSVNFSSSVGVQRVANTYDLLNAEQFVRLANEAAIEGGGEPHYPDPPESYGEGTDWQDLIYSQALQQNYQLSARGGDEDTRFALSGNFFNRGGVIENSGFRRYSFRVNLDQDISSRFRTGTNLTVSRGNYELTSGEGTSSRQAVTTNALGYLPVFGPHTQDGEYTDMSIAAGYNVIALENPVALLNEYTDDTVLNRILGNVYTEYDLLDNLYLRLSFGADVEDLSREKYQTRRLTQATHTGFAQTWTTSQANFLSENLLKFNAALGNQHSLDLTAGFTWQNETRENKYLQNADFVNDITRNDDIGAGSQEGGPDIGSSRLEWTLLSWLGRANYTIGETYLLTLTARADGSSKFGAGNKWSFFPSGAFAWRVSEESFMQELDAVSNLKVRVSYGWAGNQEIGSYSSLARLGTREYDFGGSEIVGYIPVSVANPSLKWETSRQLDVGLDLGLFGQRLALTADYYRKNTEDLLLPVTLPWKSGFNSAIKNTGSIRNVGIELSVRANVLTGDFSWLTNMNFAANRNEVTDLGESDRFFGSSIFDGFPNGSLVTEGEPIGVFYGFEADGIIADEAEAEELGYGEPGTYRIIDQNGDGQITADDQSVIGSPHPDYTYGWTNTFSYKNFELTAFLQGVYGNEVFNLNLYNLDAGNDANNNSTVRRYEGRWTPENKENATFPKAGAFTGLNAIDQVYIEDGSYLRLKTLTLGYELPLDRLGGGIGVRNARIYVQGRNLLTFTGYRGYNPDVNSQGSGSINTGYDKGSYPLTREYTVGIDLGF
jgi:TonB-linked SusC/RagA family outer membrane protein